MKTCKHELKKDSPNILKAIFTGCFGWNWYNVNAILWDPSGINKKCKMK